MTSRERSAIEQDRQDYGLAYQVLRHQLADLRTELRFRRERFTGAKLTAEMLYQFRELARLEEETQIQADLAGRVARQARDLHLELLR